MDLTIGLGELVTLAGLIAGFAVTFGQMRANAAESGRRHDAHDRRFAELHEENRRLNEGLQGLAVRVTALETQISSQTEIKRPLTTRKPRI